MLKIIKYPHKNLRVKAKPVKKITEEIKQFSQDLLETLVPKKDEPLGVGLAATQVNKLHRIFVCLMSASTQKDEPNKKFEICINPEIIKASKKTLSSLPQDDQFLEGCLSIPNYYGFVDRSTKIKVRYQTLKDQVVTKGLVPPFSSYFAHELDHLNGKLFIDYVKKNHEQLYLADQKRQLNPVENSFA